MEAPVALPPAAPPAAPAPLPPPLGHIAAPARARAPESSLKLEFQPLRAGIDDGQPIVELQLTLRNQGPETATAIRIRPALISASPEQEQVMQAFHAAGTLGGSAVQPFTLAPGEQQAVPLRLTMPADAIHVVTVSDRPMFVPVVMIDIAWRGGLSLKRLGADFMVGIQPAQGGRLGPIWLDREARMHEDVTARIVRRAS